MGEGDTAKDPNTAYTSVDKCMTGNHGIHVEYEYVGEGGLGEIEEFGRERRKIRCAYIYGESKSGYDSDSITALYCTCM